MYIIINVGCLCCDTPSEVVASFETREAAEETCTYLQHDKGCDLQHKYMVFNVPDHLLPLSTKYHKRVENGKKLYEARMAQLEQRQAAKKNTRRH